ncbi:MAG: HEAT repeat domain-containing protein, partial [Candidatus Wallbacteria bacterium]|nr:HEAT repeat domain-containing protein [Candidatus Wallbacteria bacterium]
LYSVNAERFLPYFHEVYEKTDESEVFRIAVAVLADKDREELHQRILAEFNDPQLTQVRRMMILDSIAVVKAGKDFHPLMKNILAGSDEWEILAVLDAIASGQINALKDNVLSLLNSDRDDDFKLRCYETLAKLELESRELQTVLGRLKNETGSLMDAGFSALAAKIGIELVPSIEEMIGDSISEHLLISLLKVFVQYRLKSSYFHERGSSLLGQASLEMRMTILRYLCLVEGEFSLLEKYLMDDEVELRKAAVLLCLECEQRELLDTLNARWSVEQDEKVRSMLVTTVSMLGDGRAIPWLIRYLRDADPRVRANAVEGLENFQLEDKDLEEVLPLLEDDNNRVRANAAKALWKFGGLRMISFLGDILAGNPDKWQRASAAYALGEMRSENALGILKKSIKDHDHEVRRNTVLALGKIGDPTVMEWLLGAYGGEIADVRSNIVRAVGMIGGREAFDFLSYVVKGNDEQSFQAFEVMTGMTGHLNTRNFEQFLQHPDERVVARAMQVLAQTGEDRAAELIRGFLSHENQFLSSRAKECLERLRDLNQVKKVIRM